MQGSLVGSAALADLDPGGVLRAPRAAGQLRPNGGLDCNGAGFSATVCHLTTFGVSQSVGLTGAPCTFGTVVVEAATLLQAVRPVRIAGLLTLDGSLSSASAAVAALDVTVNAGAALRGALHPGPWHAS